MNVMQTGGARIENACRDITIASDEAGRGLMLEIGDYLSENMVEFRMLGAFQTDMEALAATMGAFGDDTRAVVITGDGDMLSIYGNKFAGVRMMTADKPTRVVLGRRENDVNVVALDYMETGFGVNMESVWKFITTDFEGGEFDRRLREWDKY